MASTIDSLKWRYATKSYNPDQKLADESRMIIEEALRLAPMSFGLQPWRFIRVVDPEIRAQLKEAAHGQDQLIEASEVYVLCSLLDFTRANVNEVIRSAAADRGVSPETLAPLRRIFLDFIEKKGPSGMHEWAARHLYVALGMALAAAAENGIDTTPMEGFDVARVSKILGCKELGLAPRVILAAGYRSPKDAFADYPKTRFPREVVFIER